jgi:hypothetical protein
MRRQLDQQPWRIWYDKQIGVPSSINGGGEVPMRSRSFMLAGTNDCSVLSGVKLL